MNKDNEISDIIEDLKPVFEADKFLSVFTTPGKSRVANCDQDFKILYQRELQASKLTDEQYFIKKHLPTKISILEKDFENTLDNVLQFSQVAQSFYLFKEWLSNKKVGLNDEYQEYFDIWNQPEPRNKRPAFSEKKDLEAVTLNTLMYFKNLELPGTLGAVNTNLNKNTIYKRIRSLYFNKGRSKPYPPSLFIFMKKMFNCFNK
jgi:hypothetical protein